MGKKKAAVVETPQVYYEPERLPPMPDRTAIDQVKKGYRLLQMKHSDLLADRTLLETELRLAEIKEKRLQSECDLILDQLLAESTPDGAIPSFNIETDLPLSDFEEDTLPNGAPGTLKRPRDQEHSSPAAHEKRPRLE